VVWTRLGRIASASRTIIPPSRRGRGRHGSSVASDADDDGIQGLRRSFRSFASATMAMISKGGDDETGMAAAVFFAIKRNGDAAKGAIVHVHGARPVMRSGSRCRSLPWKRWASTRAASKIVGRGDGVKIAVKMKI